MTGPKGNPPNREHVRGATLTGELLARYYFTGDRESGRRLFEPQRAALLERARTHPRGAGLAKHAGSDDLVAEVFLRALSSGRLVEFVQSEPGSLRQYLFGKLDDVIHDMHRRIGAAKRGDGRAPLSLDGDLHGVAGARTGDALISREATPTSDARARELIEFVRNFLEPREWEVWRRSELEGATSVEIARESGVSDAAVRGVVHRARKRVLRALADRLGDPPPPGA